MNEIAIPAVPLGIITIFGLFGPYAVGALNGALAFVKKAWQKKAVSIGFSVLLAAAAIAVYWGLGGEVPTDSWASLVVWAIVVVAASYALLAKESAADVEKAIDDRVRGEG